MSGEASDFGSGIALDALTGRATQSARTMYLALLTSAPSDTTTVATMAEVSTPGYARQAVAFSAPSLLGGIPETHNSAQLTFGPFTGDPPNVPYAALVSSSSGTGGDFVYSWALDNPRDAATGESIIAAAAALSASID